MSPYFVERQLPVYEKTHEKWALDIQEVGCLLGRQLSMGWHQRLRIALCQLRQ